MKPSPLPNIRLGRLGRRGRGRVVLVGGGVIDSVRPSISSTISG